MRPPPLPAFLRDLFDEPLPRGVGWAHVLGSSLLGLLAVQALTGVLLALDYAPATTSAWESVRAIERSTWGSVVRGLHHWAASGVIVLAILHLARVYLYAAYRPPRRWTWTAGVGLLLVLFGFGLTGYLLPWDLKAYFGTQVATAIPASLPVVGPLLGRLIRGAGEVGALTLTRFYAIHVILLPAALATLVLLHVRLVRRHGITPPFADADDPGAPGHPFFPGQAWKDSLAVLLVVAGVLTLAVSTGAPLGDKADPTNGTYVPRPEWYFLGLQHLLRIFTGPWQILATAVLPGLAVTLLLLVPWIDRNRRRRPGQRPVALALGVGALAVAAGLTMAGSRAVRTEEERMAERVVGREPTPAPTEAAPAADLVGRGDRLYAALRCGTCHDPGREERAPGLPPDLSTAGRRLRRDWTAAYLLDPKPIRWLRQDVRPVLRMPDFALTGDEAAALAAYLASRQGPGPATGADGPKLLASASPDEGRQLFEQYKCRGCHLLDGRGNRVGPDLSTVGRRLRPEYLFAFLEDPGAVIPGTPMAEQIDLWEEEAAALTRFLESLR